ncbi:MAG: hypothetical protein IJL24_08345, partial [Treponema sp.]|nr:hypothetical protein [Treponema sp.]
MIGMKKSMKGKFFFAAAALALFSLAPIFGQEQNDAAPSEAQAQEISAANTSGGIQNLFGGSYVPPKSAKEFWSQVSP